MTAIKEKIKNNKLLAIVFLAYMGLLIFMPEKAVKSFKNSLYYIKEMLLIMPVILLLTSLISAWVPTKTIENNLGGKSGIKGAIFSFLIGSFSAGPIYAAFPICKMLLKKGAKVANIVIILSTWAVVKVPMLLNENKFLGPKFMIVRWILTTIAIFTMGYISSKLVKKDDMPIEENAPSAENNTITINSDYCLGCGLCSKMAPNYFALENKKAIVISQDIKKDDIENIKSAAQKCPANAIDLKEFKI